MKLTARTSRRRTPVTMAGPYAAKQVLDKKLWQENRAKIAAAALPLFVQHGYHATPVRAIAEATGLSVGSIFNYFPEKDDILREILDSSQAEVERAVAEAQGQLAAADARADPVGLFMRVYQQFVEFTARIHRFTLLAYQETKSLRPEKRVPLLERDRRIAELLKSAATPAIKAGVFSDEALDLKVQCLMVLGHMWALRRWALRQYATVADYFTDLEKIVFGIMARGPKGD